MTALVRYQAAILLRSHRWIFPVIAYAALVAGGAAGGSTPLPSALGWSSAVLVPVVAFLTRSMLTAEPDAARACVAAAAGPARAQLAALLTALGGGVVLGVAGACFDVLTSESAGAGSRGTGGKIAGAFGHPEVLLAGLATAAVCLLVATAVGALFNPPLVRHAGIAMLSTLAAAVLAVATNVSPAGAALRHASTQPQAAHQAVQQAAQWPGAAPVIGALCLAAATWAASAFTAARR